MTYYVLFVMCIETRYDSRYHIERNHQGLENRLQWPDQPMIQFVAENDSVTGFWTIVFGQYASDDMLINLDTKSFRDDQGDPRAAKAPIAAFELDNGANEWFGWPLRPWFRCFSGREQSTVLVLHQVLVKLR